MTNNTWEMVCKFDSFTWKSATHRSSKCDLHLLEKIAWCVSSCVKRAPAQEKGYVRIPNSKRTEVWRTKSWNWTVNMLKDHGFQWWISGTNPYIFYIRAPSLQAFSDLVSAECVSIYEGKNSYTIGGQFS